MADRKEFLIRIDPKLHDELRRWADAELRSLNAQVEWILRRAIETHKKDPNKPEKGK